MWKNERKKLEAAIGISRKWDAREAGREVVRTAINKLSRPPNFFLLFSTIHYEKHGGFEAFLNGVWDVLPEGTPLVGGTVAGFMNNYGCYTRGCTALAVSYSDMDIAVGIGHKTKKNPEKAAVNCANMLKNELGDSFKNGFIFDLISAGTVPDIPGMGRRRVLRGLTSKLAIKVSDFSLHILGKGVGREDEIYDFFIPYFKDFNILSGSSMDDMKILSNYQFFNKTVDTNTMVTIGLKSDLKCDINTTYGLTETGTTFMATKQTNNNRIILEINEKPAMKELLNILGWPEEYINERVYRRIFYYPIAFKDQNTFIPQVIGIFLGNSFLTTYRIKNPKIHILSASGKSLIQAVEDNINYFSGINPEFGLVSSCGIRLETLGANVYSVREKLLNFFKDKPFLLYYVGGEAAYTPKKGLSYGNESFNMAVFWM